MAENKGQGGPLRACRTSKLDALKVDMNVLIFVESVLMVFLKNFTPLKWQSPTGS